MTDEQEKGICYEEVEREFEDWNQECEIGECQKEVHDMHAQKFEACNELTEPHMMEMCHREVDASLMKMLEECYPQPPTCLDGAAEWYESEMIRCQTDDLIWDIDECIEVAKSQYNEMIA
jgi:hypothetical protein